MNAFEPPGSPLHPLEPPRRLLELQGDLPGPTVVLTAGIHGNEPAGLAAIARVRERLRADARSLRGRVVGLAGNRGALAQGVRYRQRDLNRGWTRRRINALLDAVGSEGPEDAEQRALAVELLAEEQRADGPLVVVDLHTTSGSSRPFVCMADTLRNRPLAFAMRLPVVLGLEEVIDGSMLGWLVDRGHVAIAVEGGRHDAASSIDVHEAVLWLALHQSGCLPGLPARELATSRARLAAAAQDLPRVLEIRHRHVVHEDDGFVMAPGFGSFVEVRRGQVLAEDRRGPVRCGEDALLLMPRYQPQGEDGFFLAREVRPLWLHVSAWLRSAGADRLLSWLPGVQRQGGGLALAHPRRLTVDLMHLFGYRRVRRVGDTAVYSRRCPDPRPAAAPIGRGEIP